MNVRKDDMSRWYGQTRRCANLEQAMDAAEHDLLRTSHVSIWPIREGWMVVTFQSVLVN